MKTLPKLLIISTVLLFTSFGSIFNHSQSFADEPEKVESVEVQLNVGSGIYGGLRERMEFSIGRVGEKILLSRSTSILKANRESLETAIFNVFSKVLIGFKLERVDLFPGRHSKIIVQLTPNPPFVDEVRVNLEIEGVSPEISEILQDISRLLEGELSRIIIGLPVDSIGWSEGLINQAVHYLVEREFPGYGCDFSLKAGACTEFKITLKPVAPVINDIKVSYSSSNFPVWLVKQKAKRFQEHLAIVKGIPVDFLEHYQARLEKYLTNYLNKLPELERAGLKVKLGIKAGTTTRIRVLAESEIFQTRLEARYFIDDQDNFGNFQCYLGYKTEISEIYTRYYWGDNPGGRLMAGYRWPMSTNLTGALEYEFDHYYKTFWVHYQFDRGDYFDLRIGFEGSPNEAVIGILLSDQLNLELARYDDRFGIQFMFHF